MRELWIGCGLGQILKNRAAAGCFVPQKTATETQGTDVEKRPDCLQKQCRSHVHYCADAGLRLEHGTPVGTLRLRLSKQPGRQNIPALPD